MGDKKGGLGRDSFRPFDKDISLIVKCLLKGNPLPKKRDKMGQSDRDSIDSGVGSIPDEETCMPGMYLLTCTNPTYYMLNLETSPYSSHSNL